MDLKQRIMDLTQSLCFLETGKSWGIHSMQEISALEIHILLEMASPYLDKGRGADSPAHSAMIRDLYFVMSMNSSVISFLQFFFHERPARSLLTVQLYRFLLSLWLRKLQSS